MRFDLENPLLLKYTLFFRFSTLCMVCCIPYAINYAPGQNAFLLSAKCGKKEQMEYFFKIDRDRRKRSMWEEGCEGHRVKR